MRILIAGAGGLVASELVRRFEGRGELHALRHGDLDITSEREIDEAFDRIAPDLVMNCAVVGVDDCELDPARAARVNVEGPGLLARAAERGGAAIVHFSTNYVFDGERTDGVFYRPDDEANPINVYGRTKLEGERVVQSQCHRSWIIRTSWVYGRNAASFLATLPRKLRAGQRVSAITDTFASTTYVEDLALRVDELLARGVPGVFHVVNAGVCSYSEFADHTAETLGLSDSDRSALIDRTTAAARSQPAPRPRWTPMECDRTEAIGLPPLRRWEEALDAYIAAAGAE